MEELNQLSLEEVEEKFTNLFTDYPDFELLKEAYQFASQGHAGQTRDGSDTPYIIHPLRMVIRLYQDYNERDKVTFFGAFFHDLLEDTVVSLSQIASQFGNEAATLTQDLTRERPPFETPESKHASKKAFMTKIMQSSDRHRKIITVDKIDSMFDWLFIHPTDELAKKLPRWLAQAEQMNVPLAQTLGEEYVKPMKFVIEELNRKGYRAEYENFTA